METQQQSLKPTEQTFLALSYARAEARESGATVIEPEHLLLGLLHDADSEVYRTLQGYGVELEGVLHDLRTSLDSASVAEAESSDARWSEASLLVLDYARQAAAAQRRHFIGPRHLLSALVNMPSPRLALVWEKNLDPIWKKNGIALEELDAKTQHVFGNNFEPMVRHAGTPQESDVHPTQASGAGGTWGKFTPKAQQAMWFAQNEANRAGGKVIFPSYLLAGILQAENTVVENLLSRIGIDRAMLRAALIDVLEPAQESADFMMDAATKSIVSKASAYATDFDDDYIGTEHLFLSLLSDAGPTGNLLRQYGLTKAGFLSQLRTTKSNATLEKQRAQQTKTVLGWTILAAFVLLILMIYLRII